ncbi:MAG: Eco57I restriction-modification methylase domain-containing protein, partial [Promethearchaeota archaeon]
MVNPIINQRLNEQNKNQIKIKEWIENCKSIISFSAPPLSLHNQDELLLSYLAGIWLLEFLNNNLRIKSSIEVFNKLKALTTKFPQSSPLWVFLNSIFKFLNEGTILDSLLCIKIPELQESLIDDTLGTLLQKLLGFEERKRLAANYTTMNSAKVLMKVLDTNTYSSIVDPFCGSGRLISVYLESLNNKNQFPSIRIHDLMPSAVLIAYCRLVLILSQYKQDLSLLHATIGDAFETFLKESSRKAKKYDLVLMNPPFTRTHRIGKKQRNNLSKIEQKYTKYLSGQIGLHIYAIFLADLFLNENGLLGAILPASTILSQYSRGIHEFFLSNYQLKTIASSEDEKAHSEDSNLREIILIAKKRSDIQIEGIQFLRLASQSKSNGQILPSGLISKERLAKEWNWTIFLKDPELLKIRNILIHSGCIKSGNNLDLDIVRGVEMYGPDFFFVPNCKWKIISENKNKFILKSVGSTIKIPKKFLDLYYKQGYRIVGEHQHSAVKICRWTRESLRKDRVCFKQ